MTRGARILRNIAIAVAALAVLLVAAAFIVVRTDWFRNYVRQSIISGISESTGGQVEVGSFDFDERRFRAIVRNFVIHGNEPAGARPFVSVALVEVDLRLFTTLRRIYDISYLEIDRPEVNVIMLQNGQTNIPVPKKKSASNKSTLQTVVDLAVDKCVINQGRLTFFSASQPLTVRGNSLKARLDYSIPRQAYDGQLTIEPLYVLNGRNTPVNFRVTLPVTLTRNRIDVHHATIATPVSRIVADGSVENMNNPRFSAHIQGTIAGTDLIAAGNVPLPGKRVIPDLIVEATATADRDRIDIAAAHARFGESTIEGSGALKDPNNRSSLQLRAELALRQVGVLAGLRSRPSGTVEINALARIDSNNGYDAGGNIQAKNLAFTQGNRRITGIGLASAFHIDSHNLDLRGLNLKAFGGEFEGNASLADFERYKVEGRLRSLNIQAALRALGERLPYDGAIGGPLDAQGDTKAGAKGIVANAHLTITPGRRGIPVAGRLNASYKGTADDVTVDNSFVALPHTRLNMSGSLAKKLNLSLTSKDLGDLLVAAHLQGPPPVALTAGGEAGFSGDVSGMLASPRISGHLAVNRFAIEGRPFGSLAIDIAASSTSAALSNALLVRNTMEARANASIGLREWSPVPRSPVSVSATMTNADLADIIAMAGEPPAGYSGALSASAQIGGTYGNPTGKATIQATDGTVENEPYRRIQVSVNLSDQLVSLPAGFADTPAGRIDFKADFRHPRDSFSIGNLHAHVQSAMLDLSRLQSIGKVGGKSSGTAAINADLSGELRKSEPAFQLTSVDANVSARAAIVRGIAFGDLSATAHTTRQTVDYTLTSNFAGSNIRASGNTQLAKDYPTTADLQISNLPIERALAAAGEASIPARGVLSGSAHVAGTIAAPTGNAQIDVTRAVVYDEKIDDAKLRVTYLAQSVDVPRFEVVSGPSRIDATAHFDHPAGNLHIGTARFTLAGNRLDLARSATIQRYRAGLGGIVNLNTSGSAELRASSPQILLTSLDANVSATGIAAEGKQFGDLKLTANTQSGRRLAFALDSNLAGSTIQGSGTALLNSQYPVDAKLTYRNVAWTRLAPLLAGQSGPPDFEASSDGDLTVRGPLLDTAQLSGSFNASKLTFSTIPRTTAGRPVVISNQGPVRFTLDRGLVRIQNAHLAGPGADIQASGSGTIAGQNLNLTVNANSDLSVARNFDRDVYASGKMILAATIHGDAPRPLVNGQVTLQNASFGTANVPFGISNANGAVVFNGNSAQVRNLQAESGGGRLTLSGFVTYAEALRFGLRANASNVRVRVQQGVSLSADADVRLTGTTDNSRITGTATVDRVSYASQSDFGSLLTRSAPPVQSPQKPSALLSNMKLDVRVRNLPGMPVQSSLSEDLQADIDLHIRGTVDQPGVQGRIVVSHGKLLFFGTTYSVETGSISFFNPVRVEPILDVSLKAQAQGVNVTLQVTGPVDNMKLSYTSDPPLQFQEIVSLLASGKTPTSDPTLLANQPGPQSQGFQQMGESAILGQAVANPVANQLQRVFGVTQLKIDPSFTTGSNVPTARLAMQQRITNNVTFTYVQALDQPNATVVRMEWAFNPQWSAVATRDQNGIFSLNFFYKREFR